MRVGLATAFWSVYIDQSDEDQRGKKGGIYKEKGGKDPKQSSTTSEDNERSIRKPNRMGLPHLPSKAERKDGDSLHIPQNYVMPPLFLRVFIL